MDSVAERVHSLGHFSLGSLKDFQHATHLSEKKLDFSNQQTIISNLLEDHETIIRNLRKNIPLIGDKLRDAGTSDFITGLMEQHEKMAWMLRAFMTGEVEHG